MDTAYYNAMLEKNRVYSFAQKKKEGLMGFITFYITNNPEFYINRGNPWAILEDNPKGSICYIDQLITSKSKDNPKLSYRVWTGFKEYIIRRFPIVKSICWRRWKNNRIYVFNKIIREVSNGKK